MPPSGTDLCPCSPLFLSSPRSLMASFLTHPFVLLSSPDEFVHILSNTHFQAQSHFKQTFTDLRKFDRPSASYARSSVHVHLQAAGSARDRQRQFGSGHSNEKAYACGVDAMVDEDPGSGPCPRLCESESVSSRCDGVCELLFESLFAGVPRQSQQIHASRSGWQVLLFGVRVDTLNTQHTQHATARSAMQAQQPSYRCRRSRVLLSDLNAESWLQRSETEQRRSGA